MSGNQSKGSHSAPKIGDGMESSAGESADEEVPDYPEGFMGVQKAYDDIQEIFADVAREYPNFLVSDGDDEEGSGEACGDQPKPTNKPGQFTAKGDRAETRKKLPVLCSISTIKQRPASAGFLNRGINHSGVMLPKILKPNVNANRPKTEVHDPPACFEASEEKICTISAPRFGEIPAQESEEKPEKAPQLPIIKSFDAKSLIKSDLRHESFASEFIRISGKELNQSMLTNMNDPNKISQFVAPIGTSCGEFESIHVKPYDGTAVTPSLKLIYTPPTWPHTESLYKILSRLPTLRILVLDDSKLKWLRDLGSLLPNLTTLSVMRCGLKSLDGTLGLSNLEHLFAADNEITDPSPLTVCSNIRFVDLSDNKIQNMQPFAFLRVCKSLTCMKLMENPVIKIRNFHTEMRRMIPSLRELRPRDMELHGEEVFDLYDDLPDDEEDYLQPLGWSKSTIPGTNFGDGRNTARGEPSGSGGGWREEERRLREVYSPVRVDCRKHAAKTIPYTVDEMDALLEELEYSASASPATAGKKQPIEKHSRVKANDTLEYIPPGTLPPKTSKAISVHSASRQHTPHTQTAPGRSGSWRYRR